MMEQNMSLSTSEPCGKESPVGFSAAILAEYESREAIGAPPFKWRRQAELACCRSWHTLSTKGDNPGKDQS